MLKQSSILMGFGGPNRVPLHRWMWNFIQFHLDQCNVHQFTPRKPENPQASKQNTGSLHCAVPTSNYKDFYTSTVQQAQCSSPTTVYSAV